MRALAKGRAGSSMGCPVLGDLHPSPTFALTLVLLVVFSRPEGVLTALRTESHCNTRGDGYDSPSLRHDASEPTDRERGTRVPQLTHDTRVWVSLFLRQWTFSHNSVSVNALPIQLGAGGDSGGGEGISG